jgi:hypothetical protein
MGMVVAMAQEIPASFTAETGWPCEDECSLVTSICTAKEWPLQLQRLPGMPRGISAVSVGGGWAQFCADHHLGEGAFMTFEVVDERRLVVALHCRSAYEDICPFQKPGVDRALVRDCRDMQLPAVDNPKPDQPFVLRHIRIDERPHFQKILRKSHMKRHESSRIVSRSNLCSLKCYCLLWHFRGFRHIDQPRWFEGKL